MTGRRLSLVSVAASWLLISVGLAIAPSWAHGQELATPANQSEAKQHFSRGVELYQEQSLDAALVEFERTYELYPNYKLLYNLAQVQSERHEYIAALSLYKQYLAEAGNNLSEERRRRVAEEMRKLGDRVGNLWVTSNQDGAQLFVDDKPAARLPVADYVIVNSGIRHIRLEKPGFKTTEETLKVAGGDRLRLNLPLVEESAELPQVATPAPKVVAPPPPPAAVAPPPTTPTANIDSTPLIISATVAGILTVGAATLAVLASRADSRLDDRLQEYPADEDAVDKARSRVRLLSYATDGLTVGAVVATAVALYLLLDQSHEDEPASAFVLGPNGIGGRF